MLNCARVGQGLYPVTRNASTCCFGRNLIHLQNHKLLATSLISLTCSINSKEQRGTYYIWLLVNVAVISGQPLQCMWQYNFI